MVSDVGKPVSFVQPLFWQIKYLVSGLSKKNYRSSCAELRHLVALYGYDAQVFLLRTLIDETLLQDPRHGGGGGRDQLKVQLLQSELRELESEERLGTMMCQATEACREVVTEEFASQLSKAARLPLHAQLSMAVSCLSSSHEVTQREGAKFLRAKIREYVAQSASGPRISESLLHSLLVTLRCDDAFDDKDRDALFKQLLDLHSDIDVSCSPCAGLLLMQPSARHHEKRGGVAKDLALLCAGSAASAARAASSVGEVPSLLDVGVRPCDVLEELGRSWANGGPAAMSAARDVLGLFPSLGGNARGVAEILCMAIRSGAPVDTHHGLAAGVLSAAVAGAWDDPTTLAASSIEAAIAGATDGGSCDAATIVEAIRGCAADVDWLEAFDTMFDVPDLCIADRRAFLALLSAHCAARPGEPFPLVRVLRHQRNTAAQLQFCRHAVEASATELDFTSAQPLIELVPGLPGADDASTIGGHNHCWASLPFLERLFELAEVEDYGAVRRLFDAPAEATPEALLLAVCCSESQAAGARSRGALVTDLFEKLAPPLFETEGPHSTLFQKTLAERAPVQLTRLLLAMQDRSPEVNLPKIADILGKEELNKFTASLFSGPPTVLSCQQALVAAARGTLTLSTWLSERLALYKDVAAISFSRFLRARLSTFTAAGMVPPGQPAAPGEDEAELCQAFLDAFHEAMSELSPETARKVRELVASVQQRFPSLVASPVAATAVPPPATANATPAPATPAPAPAATASAPAPATCPSSGGPPPSVPPPAPPQSAPPPPPTTPVVMNQEELEEASNGYFAKIYSGEMTVPQLIEIMKDFASHEKGSWQHEVHSKMIQNLFDECRFFPKYPPQELTTTGELFGSLIGHDLVRATNLGLALRCVLEALRRPMHTKMFRFGILALEQFLDKLPIWPQLCHHLTNLEHLTEAYPTYVEYARNILQVLPQKLRHSTALKPEAVQVYSMPKAPARIGAPPQPSMGVPGAPPLAPPPPPPASSPDAVTLDGGASSPPPVQAPPPPPAPESAASTLSTAPLSMVLPAPPSTAPQARTPIAAAGAGATQPGEVVPFGGQEEPKPDAASTRKAQVTQGSAVVAPAAHTSSAGLTSVAAAGITIGGPTNALGGSLMFGGAHTVDSLLNDPELQIEKPPAWFCDTAAQIFNSLVKENVDQKAEEVSNVLQPEYCPWLAYYLVKNRASKEVIHHPTYIEFLDKIKSPRLVELVTNTTYDCLRLLLRSVDQAVVSTSHRTVLKNLGFWLGQITLSRNKPLKSKQMDLKAALLDAYETGRLTAVLPLVCKVLEGVQRSKVFKLPNPWTAAIMALLAEIHDVPNLRTNLMFEVEVLCKHLDIKIGDLKRSELLVGKRPPPNSSDLSSAARQVVGEVKVEQSTTLRSDAAAWSGAVSRDAARTGTAAASGNLGGVPALGGFSGLVPQGTALGGQTSAFGATESGAQLAADPSALLTGSSSLAVAGAGTIATPVASQDFIVPTLPSLVVVNPTVALFQNQPKLRSLVPHAVDRSIKEVISAVVERSVTISSVTTREMVTKDFAMEPDENVLRTAAQLMVAALAGALALVTCREPLRVSLTNHLWRLLVPHCPSKDIEDTVAIEQVVHLLSTDNLELGCSLIEKAVVDKALTDIEEAIAPAIQARQDARAWNSGVPYYDQSYIQPGSKWPQALPEILRPKPGPFSAQQLKVYKDFNSVQVSMAKTRLPGGLPSLNISSLATSSAVSTPPTKLPSSFPSSQVPQQQTAASPAAPQGPLLSAAGLGGNGNGNSTTAVGVARPNGGGVDVGFYADEGIRSSPRSQRLKSGPAAGASATTSGDSGSVGAGATTHSGEELAAANSILESVSQCIRELLVNPPLLPPIDSSNPQLFKQDDALDACIALSLLPMDHELIILLRSAPQRVTQSSRPELCTIELARLLLQRLYEAPQIVPHIHPPDTVSLLHLIVEIYLATLDGMRDATPLPKERVKKVLTTWVEQMGGAQHYSVDIVSGLLRYQLISPGDFDRTLAKWVQARPQREGGAATVNASALEFAVTLLQRVCLKQRALAGTDFPKTVEVLSAEVVGPLSPQESQLVESAAELVKELSAPTTESSPVGSPLTLGGRIAKRAEEFRQRAASASSAREGGAIDDSTETIIGIFEEWHNQCTSSLESVQAQGLQHITTAGFLRSEESMERFFRVCCEYAVQRAHTDAPPSGGAMKDASEQPPEPPHADVYGDHPQVPMNFAAIDSLTRLIVWLMKLADKVQMLTRALSAIARALIRESEQKEHQFSQRPYFRILVNLLIDVSAPDPNFEQANFQLLSAFCNTFHTCNPMRVPQFTFAWLELISNRMFMPKLLMVKGQRGWLMFQRLLVQLLYFMEPYLRRVRLTDSTRLLYKGTVRMLLVLLHDFPEFLCDYHFALCDILPIPCVQIRNLILSAFPRNMKLPDPFMPNLKVDLLPEIKVAPRILANYTTTLLQLNLKADVDKYMRSRESHLLDTIKDKLLLPKGSPLHLYTRYNVPLLNALLLYVGVHLPQHGKSLPGQGGLQQNNPSLEIFMYLAHNFDYEGRYLFLSAIANHLRYPNIHTHYFSCVLLYLFADTSDEIVREQITRVLLERLIVHRPHPWGLLITFIELIKNRRYEFWSHSFVKCAPEVEKLFQSVAFTCLGSAADCQAEAGASGKSGGSGSGGGAASGAGSGAALGVGAGAVASVRTAAAASSDTQAPANT